MPYIQLVPKEKDQMDMNLLKELVYKYIYSYIIYYFIIY